MIPPLQNTGWVPEVIVLGKGPSAANREKILRRWPIAVLVTLNHAIRWADFRREVFAHFVDIEALQESAPYVRTKATRLLLPSVMNQGMKRMKTPPVMPDFMPPRILYDRGEALLRFFSVEGAVGALGILGFTHILLCGIDGGTGYAPGLEDVAHTHLLNGRPSYDIQFKQLEKVVEKFKLEVYRAAVD
jgi:hypothetical protein